MKDTYKETKTITFPGMTVKVHIPDITTEERNRRLKQIEKAAVNLLLSEERIRK